MINKLKQIDFAKIIKGGSISEIQDFMVLNFHEIKHTESFGLILNRLRDQSASLAESERALGEALGALGKINQKARLYAKGHGEKFNIELLIDIDCYSEAILNEPKPERTEPGPGAAGGFAKD